jgi:hypothetical protein
MDKNYLGTPTLKDSSGASGSSKSPSVSSTVPFYRTKDKRKLEKIEKSPNSFARCRECNKLIEEGEQRVGLLHEDRRHGMIYKYYHYACLNDSIAASFNKASSSRDSSDISHNIDISESLYPASPFKTPQKKYKVDEGISGTPFSDQNFERNPFLSESISSQKERNIDDKNSVFIRIKFSGIWVPVEVSQKDLRRALREMI